MYSVVEGNDYLARLLPVVPPAVCDAEPDSVRSFTEGLSVVGAGKTGGAGVLGSVVSGSSPDVDELFPSHGVSPFPSPVGSVGSLAATAGGSGTAGADWVGLSAAALVGPFALLILGIAASFPSSTCSVLLHRGHLRSPTAKRVEHPRHLRSAMIRPPSQLRRRPAERRTAATSPSRCCWPHS
jgi:hypothetical protein